MGSALRINQLKYAGRGVVGQVVTCGWGWDNLSRRWDPELAWIRVILYKYLYTKGPDIATLLAVTDGSPPDVVFEGNSREVIRSFPKDIRSDLGADLDRVQNGEKPLDSAPMATELPGG